MVGKYWLRRLAHGFLAFVFACGSISALLPAQPVAAAGELTVTPITWDVVGLDSNRPEISGPELFPVGAEVCNTSGAIRDLTVTLQWADTNTTTIKERPGSLTTLNFPDVANGACVDAYFEIQITRDTASFGQTRGYTIVASYDSGTPVTGSTPAGRQIIVESLVSQNRNTTMQIRYCDPNAGGSGYCEQDTGAGWQVLGGGGSINLAVGNTYLIELTTVTATAYEEVQSFLTLSNTIFQVLSVSTKYSTLTAPPGRIPVPNPRLWGDGCLWDSDPASPSYHSCLSTGKAGGTVTTLYEIDIISGGGESVGLEALIYDRSGGSFHYNTDYSLSPGDIHIIDPTDAEFSKRFVPATIAAGEKAMLRFTITNPNPVTVAGYAFADPLPDGMVVADPANASNTCGGTIAATPGAGSVNFEGGVIGANSSCTVVVDVTVAAAGSYTNISGNLFIGDTDTGKTATAPLTVTTEPPTPLVCAPIAAGTTIAKWTNATGGAFDIGVTPNFAPDTPGTGELNRGVNTAIGTGITSHSVDSSNQWVVGIAGISPQTKENAMSLAQYFEFVVNTEFLDSVSLSFTFSRHGNAAKYFSLVYGPDAANLTTVLADQPVSTDPKNPSLFSVSALTTGFNPNGNTIFRFYIYDAANPNQDFRVHSISFTGTGEECTSLPSGETPPNPPQLSKAFSPASVRVGEEATLSFTLSNPNATTLTGLTFRDELPYGMTVVSGSFTNTGCGGSWDLENSNPGMLLFTDGTLAANTSCMLSVRVIATSLGANLNLSDPIDARESLAGNSAEATLTLLPPPATPSIVKRFDPNPLLNPTGSTKLTFRITNNDPTLPINQVAFTDVLPAVGSVQMVPVTPSPLDYTDNSACGAAHSFTWDSGTHRLIFSGGTIAAGQVCEISLDVQVPGVDVTGGPVAFPNETSQVSHVFNETIYYGNTAEDTLVVDTPIPGLALRKEVGLSEDPDGTWSDFTEVEIGDDVYYKLIIENIGEVALSNITVSDSMVDASACPWTASGFTLPVADVSAPEAHIATCIVGPVTAVAGDVDNTATADSAETDALADDADYYGFNPTAVTLARFEAAAQGEAVLVTWETATELDNLGFNLYRSASPAGPWTLVNADLIPAQNPGAVFGATYEWLDTDVTPGEAVYYRLEDVDVSGVSTFHGPVSATASGVTTVRVTAFGAATNQSSLLTLTLMLTGALAITFSIWNRRRSSKLR